MAAVNYELAAALLEQKPPVDIGDESGPASITSKADILKFLKESFEYVHKAIETINEKNLVETVKSPFRRRIGVAAWAGHERFVAWFRPLRSNGRISADERDCAAGQPLVTGNELHAGRDAALAARTSRTWCSAKLMFGSRAKRSGIGLKSSAESSESLCGLARSSRTA